MDRHANLSDGDSDIDEYLPDGLESDLSEIYSEEEMKPSELTIETFDRSLEPTDDISCETSTNVVSDQEIMAGSFNDAKVATVTSSFLSVPQEFKVSSKESQRGKRKRKRKNLDNKNLCRGKRKRTKNVQNSDNDSTSFDIKKRKASNKRKNLKKFLTQDQLGADTIVAQHEEEERKKRLELHKLILLNKELPNPPLVQPMQQSSLVESTLENFESSNVVSNSVSLIDQKPVHECIILDSSSGSDDEGKTVRKHVVPSVKDLIEISSSDEEDVSRSDDEAENMDNSGMHTNDNFNQPDTLGRVQINVGHPPNEDDIFLAPQISKVVKPHQIGGIRFLYDNLVESLSRFKQSSGFGCILAHSMGLGKTLQMIAFIDIFFRYCGAKHALCIVPINTLQNWLAEFNLWIPPPPTPTCSGSSQQDPEKVYRNFGLFVLNDTHRTTVARAAVINEWYNKGGVILIGYEMYRLLSQKKFKVKNRSKKSKNSQLDLIDLEDCEKKTHAYEDIYQALVTPGPDLIICDEGHRIKNNYASISQALKNIVTKRRVVLTGYPLQNNLLEYWCMVDFVRPNFLGTKTEFCNLFERPIVNGQCVDSTLKDRKLMQYRSHVLHSLLQGFVQRRNHSVLTNALPAKQEHVLLVHLTTLQKLLYHKFMKYFMESTATGVYSSNPIKAFSVCCKIWNHPDILYEMMQQKNEGDEEIDLDLPGVQRLNVKGQTGSLSKQISLARVKESSANSDRNSPKVILYDWAKDVMNNYTPHQLHNSNKMVLFMYLLENSIKAGDKMLVFSQSLSTLSVIEYFLSKQEITFRSGLGNPVWQSWIKNKTYYRLDGSTGASDREKMINNFNLPHSSIQLFLLSTRAGCLGINLVGANRVVIFDASWNPCHDAQAVCRIYRYGQTKKCHIYRLVSHNTLEKKIYDRQISKQGMSNRIVDELNPMANFTKKEVESLLEYNEEDMPYEDFEHFANQYQDQELKNICFNFSQCIAKEPFSHESLLLDQKGMRLSGAEKKQAKQSYEAEKKMNVTYSRQSYSAYYAKSGSSMASPTVTTTSQMGHQPHPYLLNAGVPLVSNLHRNLSFGRPIASVKPIQSTTKIISSCPTLNSPPELQQKLLNLKQAGVTVQRIITTTDITFPGTRTTTTVNSITIKAGEPINMIRTQKGTYIRTSGGKIYAVRSSQQNIKAPLEKPIVTVSGLVPQTRVDPVATCVSAVSPLLNTAVSSSPIQKSNVPGSLNNSGLLNDLMVGNISINNTSNTSNIHPLITSTPSSNFFAQAITNKLALPNFQANSLNVSQGMSVISSQSVVSSYPINTSNTSCGNVLMRNQPIQQVMPTNSLSVSRSSIPSMPFHPQEPLDNNVASTMIPNIASMANKKGPETKHTTFNPFLARYSNQTLAAQRMLTASSQKIDILTNDSVPNQTFPPLASQASIDRLPTEILALMSVNSKSNDFETSGLENTTLAAAQSQLSHKNIAIPSWSFLEGHSIRTLASDSHGSTPIFQGSSNDIDISHKYSMSEDIPKLQICSGSIMHGDLSSNNSSHTASPLVITTNSSYPTVVTRVSHQKEPECSEPPFIDSADVSVLVDTDGDNNCSENMVRTFDWNCQ